MFVFFLTEKRRECVFIFLREKKERNKNNQECHLLDYSIHKRGFEAILAPTRRLSKSQKTCKKIVIWNWSWQLWRQGMDFALQEVFLESLPIEIKFWIVICYVMFLLHVCVVMHVKYLYYFIFYIIPLRTSHIVCGLMWIWEI